MLQIKVLDEFNLSKRMHSSRMRTGRSLTVCCSLLSGRGDVCLVPGGVSAWSWGGLPGPGGVSAWSGGWVCLVPGGLPEDPPMDRITDTCKNITLATTSLQLVITALKRSLRKLCFNTCLSVILFAVGGGSASIGDLPWGSASRGAWVDPPLDTTKYGQRAGGTHPTGMHSCLQMNPIQSLYLFFLKI